MAHEAETQSPANLPASAASDRRKRLILLCCEDLRPVACALEDALRSRGWQVDVEFGADAKPWVQQVPPVRPSLRVLCVPGTVDPTLAQQLRAAFRPEPDADLHILGVDDSPGLVQEIERLAGVRTPARRPLAAAPRLAHVTLVEQQVRRDRTWRVAAVSALAALLVTLGGTSLVEHSARAPELSPGRFASGITSLAAPRPADLDAEAPRLREPVLAAVAPADLEGLDEPLPAADDEVVLLDDETPPEEPRALEPVTITSPAALGRTDVLASPLSAPASDLPITEPVTAAIDDTITVTSPPPTLPAGFLPVAGIAVSDAEAPKRPLPKGFLPVAGMTAPPPTDTIDPFPVTAPLDAVPVTVTAPVTTVDPFGP